MLVLLISHWVSMLGTSLVTLAGFSWLFLLPLHMRGRADNPYVGLLVFILIPIAFFLGLLLIPIGIALAKRKGGPNIELKNKWRRVAIFLGVMTTVNLVLGSQLSYRAVEHMETVQFCGQTCHVMKPEFTAHQQPPHSEVRCTECHVAPGAGGWIQAKAAGTRQLLAVMTDSYTKPIESAMESNRLVSSADTCEHCHARNAPMGDKMRVISKFKDDEANTRTETVLMLHVGGAQSGGIHGAHLGPGVTIRYAAQEKKRENLPWVEYTNSTSGDARTYVAAGATPDAMERMPKFVMQCVDCHNRAAHAFENAERAIDTALAAKHLPPDLPFLKKTGLALIRTDYKDERDAAVRIPAELAAFYERQYPGIAHQREKEIRAAGDILKDIYARNVFPDLKVTWDTYPNRLGHVDSPGCFRCHDDNHFTAAKKTITQDCNACHQVVALEEGSPEVLKQLGLAK